MRKLIRIGMLLGMTMLCMACDKTFLDKKPRSAFLVPQSLADFQQLLDNGNVMFPTSELPEVMSDNFYLKPEYWANLSNPVLRNAYVWTEDIYQTVETNAAWNTPYQQIFYANVVLDGLPHVAVNANNQQEWRRIKGSALFIRSYALHNLAQLFAPVYDEASADRDAGLPLPQQSDVNQPIIRTTVRETYDRIISDLHEAEEYLSNPRDYARPSRPALMALLARVYLTMGEYGQAGDYADKCLQEYDALVDFNKLTPTTFGVRDEAIYLSYMNPATIMTASPTNVFIAPELYESYEAEDRRKDMYYRLNAAGEPNKAISHQFSYQFTGLGTDEMLLIRAESRARAGNIRSAMDDLNLLLRHRWEADTYVEKKAGDEQEALRVILAERRKELAFRNLRWSDLRRLNKEGAGLTLERSVGADRYRLEPGSPNWVFPIPPNEIMLSGIQQNPPRG